MEVEKVIDRFQEDWRSELLRSNSVVEICVTCHDRRFVSRNSCTFHDTFSRHAPIIDFALGLAAIMYLTSFSLKLLSVITSPRMPAACNHRFLGLQQSIRRREYRQSNRSEKTNNAAEEPGPPPVG